MRKTSGCAVDSLFISAPVALGSNNTLLFHCNGACYLTGCLPSPAPQSLTEGLWAPWEQPAANRRQGTRAAPAQQRFDCSRQGDSVPGLTVPALTLLPLSCTAASALHLCRKQAAGGYRPIMPGPDCNPWEGPEQNSGLGCNLSVLSAWVSGTFCKVKP